MFIEFLSQCLQPIDPITVYTLEPRHSQRSDWTNTSTGTYVGGILVSVIICAIDATTHSRMHISREAVGPICVVFSHVCVNRNSNGFPHSRDRSDGTVNGGIWSSRYDSVRVFAPTQSARHSVYCTTIYYVECGGCYSIHSAYIISPTVISHVKHDHMFQHFDQQQTLSHVRILIEHAYAHVQPMCIVRLNVNIHIFVHMLPSARLDSHDSVIYHIGCLLLVRTEPST